jgi:uncharacterized membrane protein YcaP (DUF421 family)
VNFNLFSSWEHLAVVVLKTAMMYVYGVLLLRLGGKRTTGRIATFDYISVIVIGPLVASTILSSSVALLDGMAALTGFVGLQWVVSYLATRSPWFAGIVTTPPSVLFSESEFLRKNINSERVHEDEIMSKIRVAGHASTASVKAVILESTGDIAVINAAVPDKPVEVDPAVLGRVHY